MVSTQIEAFDFSQKMVLPESCLAKGYCWDEQLYSQMQWGSSVINDLNCPWRVVGITWFPRLSNSVRGCFDTSLVSIGKLETDQVSNLSSREDHNHRQSSRLFFFILTTFSKIKFFLSKLILEVSKTRILIEKITRPFFLWPSYIFIR